MIWSAVAGIIRRGYVTSAPIPSQHSIFRRSRSTSTLKHVTDSEIVLGLGETIAFVFPTMVANRQVAVQRRRFVAAFRQIEDSARANGVRAALFLVIQWRTSAEAHDAQKRISEILSQIPECSNTSVFGLVFNGNRKAASLNLIISLIAPSRPLAIGWLDDDVVLDRNCIQSLVDSFLSERMGAIGARKFGVRGRDSTSRLLFLAKQFTQPAMNYPHGCCILVKFSVVSAGIPPRYFSEDGFIFFELLHPHSERPLEDLVICTTAKCYHRVGSDSLAGNARRIRRMLLNHIIFLADYPPEKGIWYIRNSLFWGFWPISPRRSAGVRPADLSRWVLKALYFLIFCLVAVELAIRGTLGAPLRAVRW